MIGEKFTCPTCGLEGEFDMASSVMRSFRAPDARQLLMLCKRVNDPGFSQCPDFVQAGNTAAENLLAGKT
jgi:hypothetical protein